MPDNLVLRVVTAVLVLPLFVGAMFLLPNGWWAAALTVPLLIAGHEWARLGGFDNRGVVAFLVALLVGCLVLWSGAGMVRPVGGVEFAVYALSVLFWCLAVPCWLWLRAALRGAVWRVAAGLIVLLPAWLALVRLQNDTLMLLALLGVVWLADSAAYFAGKALGRRRLAPTISPGKTWEGVAGALAAVPVYALALHYSAFPEFDLIVVMMAMLGMTCLSIIGDLFESWLKRTAGVKDSGGILPGHGGMLDRIDGLSAALPLAALVFARSAV